MRCIEIENQTLIPAERDIPAIGDDEVLIRVAAAGVNRPDVVQRQGKYPPPPGASDIPGLEVSGVIERVGEKVTRWQEGDRVCALLSGGGYAEFAVAHESLCLPIPAPISLEDAAALPETTFTVWTNLFHQGALKPGQTLLIHGGSSGIGTTAIQMATALGIRVIVTAGSDEKCARCIELGAIAAINYREQDFVPEVKTLTDGKGANMILDMVGGDYVARNIKASAFRGRIVNIAFLKGSRVKVDLMPVMLKQLTLTGSTLRSRPVAEKTAIASALAENIWP
ncbi:MAG: NAD(P)H-quinone oxidoreductase, partial [bacterium]